MDNNSRPPLAALLARDDEIARLEQQLSIVTMQRDMARTELAELRAALDTLFQALSLMSR